MTRPQAPTPQPDPAGVSAAISAVRSLRGLDAPPPSAPLTPELCAAALDELDIDAASAAAGQVAPTGRAHGTIYWLQGPARSVATADVARFSEALRRARVEVARGKHEAAHRLRLSFLPIACALSDAASPAKQGYALAREVRARLELGSAPLSDLPTLLKQRLGVPVYAHPFESHGATAAAVLDHRRAAAVILIDCTVPAVQRNPRLLRVAIAHELCHLLFDPPRGQGVGLSLDLAADQGEAARAPRAPTDAEEALEQRARAFAAELLLPRDGVSALIADRAEAAGAPLDGPALIEAVADHFDTPREIAFRHIQNTLRLPVRDADLLAITGAPHPAPRHGRLLPLVPAAPARPPAQAKAAWRRATAWLEDEAAASVARAALRGLHARRGDRGALQLSIDVMLLVEDLVDHGQLDALDALIADFEPSAWPLEVARGLALQLRAVAPRPPGLDALLQRVEDALLAAPGWDRDRVQRFMARAR